MKARVVKSGRVVGRILLFLFLLSELLIGCAYYDMAKDFIFGTSQTASGSPEEVFNQAERLFRRQRWQDARDAYKKYISLAPQSEYTVYCEMAIGKTLYLAESYEESAKEFARFVELHPKNELADDAQFFLGMSYFKNMPGMERDPTNTNKALIEFRNLLINYPYSPFIKEAEAKIKECSEILAEKAFYVGYYYYWINAYPAAIGRFRELLKNYPGVSLEDKAMYYLAESLWQDRKTRESMEVYQELLKKYPKNGWRADARKRLDEGQKILAK
jgi:outer membrane protein assembly factor BamD